jgi:hypothetical protein
LPICSTTAPSNDRDTDSALFTAVRALALAVVVLWHWVFATVRWTANGPRTGNPLHLVPAGFVLTWFLQVMPLFFLIGGWASRGSYDRHAARGRTDRSWLRARCLRLAAPVFPLVVGLVIAKITLSPWAFGVVLLAVSPLWFLGVYLPLTLVTPLLVRAHRGSTAVTLTASASMVALLQYARFVFNRGGLAITLLSFLAVWGFVYQVGFHLDRLCANRFFAVRTALLGIAGIIAGTFLGFSPSMVTTTTDKISNMGPPTMQIMMLGLFQAGLIATFAPQLTKFAKRIQVESLTQWIDARQMKIYTWHLPIWVVLLLIARNTSMALTTTATSHWLLHRPIWLLVPLGTGIALERCAAVGRSRMQASKRAASLHESAACTPGKSN